MRRNPRVMPLNLKIAAAHQYDGPGRQLPDIIVVTINEETTVKECDEETAKAFVGEVKALITEWLTDL